MAKPSEDTLTTIFKEFLVEKGVNVEAFPIWRTPMGIRKPDLLCKNSKFYPLEAKIKEKDLVKDIIKVQNNYMKHAKTLNIGGSFILKHPNPQKLKLDLDEKELKRKLRKAKFLLILIFPQDDPRQFERIKGSVDELISIIVDTINYKRIKKELQPDVVIEILRNTTKYLNDALKNVKMEILLDTLGGFEFFKDILDIDVKKQYSSITVAISFFILTQLLFYHIVAKYRTKKLKPLNEIKKIDELNEEYFSKVLDINYRVIFGIDVVSHLPNTAVDHINKIILTLKSIRPENIRSDLLGSIFHDLIPLNVRKRVAAYYTNVLAAELLAHLTIDNYDNVVLDLACGSGGLLVAGYNRKRQLLEKKKEFTQEDHNKFIKEDLFGIDIMPFSVNIASCNVSLQSPEYITNRVNIGLWDSIDLQPGDIIPEFATLKFSFRTKTMDSWIINEKTRRITELEAESKDEKEFLTLTPSSIPIS